MKKVQSDNLFFIRFMKSIIKKLQLNVYHTYHSYSNSDKDTSGILTINTFVDVNCEV